MIRMGVVIQYGGWPGIPKRKVNQIVRRALILEAKHWHKNTLPMHFRANAARRYGYQKRSKTYEQAKRKKKGHNKPLTWSGGLERSARQAPRIKASGKHVTLTMAHLPFVNFSGKSRSHRSSTGRRYRTQYPDLRAELTAKTQPEMNRMGGRVAKYVSERLNKVRAKRTVKIR